MLDAVTMLEAVLALPAIYGAKVSPDGQWVVWTWFRTAPAAEVYAVRTDGSGEPVRLTNTPENTYVVGWTPDSTAVIVAQDYQGNERMQLFRVRVDAPLTMDALTDAEPNYFIRGGRVDASGRWLVYGANVNGATGEEIEPTWVYRHDLTTGERRPLAKTNKGCYYTPELSPDGQWVLYQRNERNPAGYQLWLVGMDGEGDREIFSAGDDKKAEGVWTADGRGVVVLAETETHWRVGVWWRESGEVRWLIDDPARNVENLSVHPLNGMLMVQEVQSARTRCSLLDIETGEERMLPAIPGELVVLGPAAEGGWIGQYFSSTQPADIVRFSLDDVRPEAFVSRSQVWARTTLQPGDLTPAEDFRWVAEDGLEIQGWLYRTRRAAKGGAKGTVVYVHGGPTGHSRDMVNPQIQYFAALGYHVLDPNYRGSTGFGRPFMEAIKADGWGGREQDDIAAGVRALIAAGMSQPGKVGITGTSYGGYSAWCAITRYAPEVIAASAPICGMTDLVVDYETTRPDLRLYSEEMMGGSPADVPGKYAERSPIHFVGRISGRLLIVQGLQDPNVSPENVRVVRTKLDEAGIEYEVLAFDDEGHGISKPKNQKVLYQALAQFFGSAFGEAA